MAKGQKRTSREAKKPKADKKTGGAAPATVSSALAKPTKPAAGAEGKKK